MKENSEQYLPLGSRGWDLLGRGLRELSGVIITFYIMISFGLHIGLRIYQNWMNVHLRFVHFSVCFRRKICKKKMGEK